MLEGGEGCYLEWVFVCSSSLITDFHIFKNVYEYQKKNTNINSIYFVILWNGIDSNLRRGECKVLVILEIPSHENSRGTGKITHICLHQIGLFLVLYS